MGYKQKFAFINPQGIKIKKGLKNKEERITVAKGKNYLDR